MKNNSIFGHFFIVTNFKGCESQYDHGFLWVANAPTYNLDLNNVIENFVDKYISCDNHKLVPNLSDVQTHCHKKIHRTKNKTICQFNFPWPTMEKFLKHSQ